MSVPGAMKLRFPPFETNPFSDGIDPRDERTVILPHVCIEMYGNESVVLKSEVRRWLAENAPQYACRVIEPLWVTDELAMDFAIGRDARHKDGSITSSAARRYKFIPFISFENDNDAILFKLRWC